MRRVTITLTIILNGDMILLKKEKENWKLPSKELENNHTSIKSSIKLLEQIFQKKFEDITNQLTIEHDSILKPWSIDTHNEIEIQHGLCLSSETIPTTQYDYYWTPLETLNKILIVEEEGKFIKQFIDTVNEELETLRIKRIYNQLYHDVT